MHVVKVPVAIETGADNFEVVDDVQWIGHLRLLRRGSRPLVGVARRLLQQEAIEATVTCGDNVAYLHLLR